MVRVKEKKWKRIEENKWLRVKEKKWRRIEENKWLGSRKRSGGELRKKNG